ncbi:hypothetical protein AC579_9993 [Pseudocercospora musae]|uniref:Histone deacetylase interacting domain-containing protein n=1 Tax=Pseudocercospora musae TaxID=113226 RepID=A0A139H6R9_9PEZI|nr:hypothetical protein AC579_9993 [Pseudocercospora musae]
MDHGRWPHQPGGNSQHANEGQYGPGHQSPPSGPSGLPHPAGPYSSYQAHSLASLAGLSQSSPRQPPLNRPEDPRSQPPPQGPGFPLPGLSQATGQPSAAERERERERARELDQQIHIKEEEDRRHREEERRRMEQAPQHQAPPGPPAHLHQPVAVGPRNPIHGPNGLLGNPALAVPQPQPLHTLGAPSGPGNVFAGGPVQPSQPPSASQQHAVLLAPPYGPGAPGQQQQQMAQGQQGQGQQPILNDALSYLDQVKVQFAEHPDVYNRFLDIMKDFKSGAIDTPGVIGRVSQLFAGNPELIQGFNTFLPPGYRIECGQGDDPNVIRVTTPMGTTVSNMPTARPLSRQDGPHDGGRPTNGTFTPQPGSHSAQMAYSPSGRPVGPVASGQQHHLSPLDAAARQREQETMHAIQERGVNSLQNAVSAATGMAGIRAGVSPRATPLPGQADATGAIDGAGLDKQRGPVEFNHAISYVNKIKNRFASQPDIYKQFLEILQTYQRESKPIQDVYGQVTHLFKTAPDLLEDFKQFLPESAAQAKAAERARAEAEVITSNMRNDGAGIYGGSPIVSREPHMGTPGQSRGLPPVGNFAPTPASTKDKKRQREVGRQGTAGAVDGAPGPSRGHIFPGPPTKRAKHNNNMQTVRQNEQPPVSPTLVPSLPMPLEPTTTSAATDSELAFFDKAKKAISNKNVFNEFLKLCNLFSQDLIDRGTLIYRAQAFIGSNPDLLKWFRDWLGYDERDILIENKPRVPSGRVMLSNCRGLGPSYRLLPKRERQKPCSGRDELCNSVLNDDWASHPTWASEDSGFIAHRKNVHEEGLHRIEEERHDYDFNIEAAARTVQLLEPIATQLRRMDDLAQRNYQLPPGLGGQSETIYKRVVMKIYGREKGREVIESLHHQPFQVIPVLLNRIKERLESWKMAQREWEKVWREQTQKMFWKSLDHQAAQAKQMDRRAFQAKTLQGEIQVRYEEMKRQSNNLPGIMREPQLEFNIFDNEVLLDATHLILVHIEQVQLSTDHPKLVDFIKDFVPLFFGLDITAFRKEIELRSENSAIGDELLSGGEETASIGSRKGNGKIGDLRRAALDPSRGRKPKRDGDSNASASRASTPDVASNADPDEMAIETIEEVENKADVSTNRWFEHPVENNLLSGQNVNPLEPQARNTYRLWANSTIYCFLRLFIMLYERLHKIKLSEASVRKAIDDAKQVKPAVELGIIDKIPSDYFQDVSGNISYYNQMLLKLQDFLEGAIEMSEVEEVLRRFYLQSGYPLYPFEKLISTLAKDAIQVINSDSKEKSAEIYHLFKKDRVKDTSTAQQQTDYRKSVEKMVKDGELYRVEFDQLESRVRIFVTKRDEAIADDGLTALDRETRWRYYIASYSSLDDTDGVDQSAVGWPYLNDANYKSFFGSDPSSGAAADARRANIEARRRFFDSRNEEKLKIRIAVNNYRAFFQAESFETWTVNDGDRSGGEQGEKDAQELHDHREETLMDRFVNMNSAMKEKSREDVEKANSSFGELVEKGVLVEEEGAADDDDVEMD